MIYASDADIAEIYGRETLDRLTDAGDQDGSRASITRALAFASAQIDSYIGARYALPLPSMPDLLRMLAIDIAVYRIAQDHTRLTDEILRRYSDAIDQLKALSSGRAVLPLAPASISEAPPTLAPAPTIIVTDAAERVMDRNELRRL